MAISSPVALCEYPGAFTGEEISRKQLRVYFYYYSFLAAGAQAALRN